MQFAKPTTTFDEQLDLLTSRGMTIPNRQTAIHYLQHLNYYRLRGYSIPFEIDWQNHRFAPGTRIDDVLNLYIFDRELRLLLIKHHGN